MRISLITPVFERGTGNQIPQKNEKKEKTRLEVFRVAGIKNYVVDEKGNEYLCNSRLMKDLRKGFFVKAKVEKGKIKILAIFS